MELKLAENILADVYGLPPHLDLKLIVVHTHRPET
jgi:hypothetical protein